MALSHWNILGAPLTGGKDLPIKNPPLIITPNRVSPLQVNCKEEQKLQAQKTVSISRRDTMRYLTAGALSGVALLSTEPAEARVGRLEMKRKIMEKLEMLREKAGVSKPKTENGIKTPPAPLPSEKEKKLPTLQLPPSSPNPRASPVRPLAEATLP